MKRCILLLTLLSGAPVCVFADSANTTDLSIKYLGQIFGDVPGALTGSGTGLIGGLFNVFNQGVMAVAAIWLMYTIFQVCIMTAMGDHPQKSLKNCALWLRVAVGFGMLIPGPSGYCLAQELMMQVVVQGVNLANKTWDYALDYMQQGGKIFVPPNASGGLTNITQLKSYIGGDGTDSKSQNTLMYQLFNNEVCMYLSNQYNDAYKKQDTIALQGSKADYNMIPVQPRVGDDGKLMANTGVIFFPGYGDTSVDVPVIGKEAAHNCGEVSVPTLAKSATQTQYQEAYQALMGAALAMQPLANDVAHAIKPDSAAVPGSERNQLVGAQALFNSVSQYMYLIQPVANYMEQQKNANGGETFSSFVDQAKQQGWFNAGGFYWDMVRWNNQMATQAIADPTASNYVPLYTMPKTNAMPKELIDNMSTARAHLSLGMWGDARQQISSWISGKNAADYTHQDVTGSVTIGWDLNIITTPINEMISTINADLSGGNMKAYNPMQISYDIGKKALSSAGEMWQLFVEVITPLSIAAGICDSVNPGNVVIKGIISWLTPLLTASSGFLFATGCMLTFYVPIYPYLLFLFGVVGWLLSIVEAMVASPLVAFGMTHPEGHDFLGKAESALMLALGVFLRPTLMIIGYLVGVLMVYVVSGFLNQVLGRVFVSTYQPTSSVGFKGDGLDGLWVSLSGSTGGHPHFTGHNLSDAMVVPVFLTMYSMIMIEVVNQCFSAIHQVPDMVLRWIGGPTEQSQAAQHAQAIKGAVGQAGQQAGSVGTEAAKSTQGMGTAAGGTVGDLNTLDNNQKKRKERNKNLGKDGDNL